MKLINLSGCAPSLFASPHRDNWRKAGVRVIHRGYSIVYDSLCHVGSGQEGVFVHGGRLQALSLSRAKESSSAFMST